MKSWQILLIGAAVGVAAVIIARKLLGGPSAGAGGLGGPSGVDVPPPNAPWWNLGVKPMDYAYTGWNPPEAWRNASQQQAARLRRLPGGSMAGLRDASTAYPVVLSPYPQYQTTQQTYVIEEPVDWRSPQIDAKFSSQIDPF